MTNRNSSAYRPVPLVIEIPKVPRENGRQWQNLKHLVFCLVSCLASAMAVHIYDNAVMATGESMPEIKSLSDPDPNAPWPRVAWLMSFPNSGTTFTLDLVKTMTNRTVATNYGQEPQKEGIPMIGFRTEFNKTGPFLLRPEMLSPETYVLTKTHCGGRCSYCGPETYIETVRSFDYKCRTGSILVKNTTKVHVTYHAEGVVERAVHLIRNPFDNLVARLHMERFQWQNKAKEDPDYQDVLTNFTDTRLGLHAWCDYMDKFRAKDDERSHFIDDELSQVQQQIPCHAEFYRYVQWHNLALEVTRRRRIPVYTLFYEDYTTNFDKAVGELLDFLQLKPMQPAPEFVSGKHYEEYFDKRERKAVAKLMWELASPETWDLLRHYVEEWLDV